METQRSRVVQVLELILQNTSTALDAATICSLLCSSKAVRAAAQQAGGPCTNIWFGSHSVDDWHLTSLVASFAKWLPPHAHLVGQIALNLGPQPRPAPEDENDSDGTTDAAYHVLETILDLSAQHIIAGSRTTSSASTAALSSKQQQQQRPPFALRSFSSTLQHGAEVLQALPAATLTSLSCVLMQQECPQHEFAVPAAAAAALAGLTSLRQLCLHERMTGVLLASVAALPQLTSLSISCMDAFPEELQQLPAGLRQLELGVNVCIHPDDEADSSDDEEHLATLATRAQQNTHLLSLTHLTCLTNLELRLHGVDEQQLQVSVQLPPQLLELTAGADNCAVLPLLGGVSALQQLRHLKLSNCHETQHDMVGLTALTALMHIDLQYEEQLGAMQTTSAWAQLSALRSLHIVSTAPDDGGLGFRAVMAGAAAATSLRQLHLDFREGVAGFVMRPKLFGYFTGLRQLQELAVVAKHVWDSHDATDADDTMQLTALTGLTHLDVACWPVKDTAAVALACSLPELRMLKLYDCGLESTAALPAIGRLTHLQHLDLRYNAFGCDKCLQLLTQLRGVTCLHLVSRDGEEPTGQQYADFFAAVRGQR